MPTNTEVERRRFQSNVERAYLTRGSYIRITKIKKKKGFSSKVNVGQSKTGHISKPLEFNEPLCFYEMPGMSITSSLKNIFIEKDKTVYIETRTSIYKVTFL